MRLMRHLIVVVTDVQEQDPSVRATWLCEARPQPNEGQWLISVNHLDGDVPLMPELREMEVKAISQWFASFLSLLTVQAAQKGTDEQTQTDRTKPKLVRPC